MILGGGPNRVGQGIEFDYCCVHAAFALRELGFETIMVNSNPETVSTDYDTSDKLYFEPLTLEDVLNIYDQEQPEGVIVQFGGQTPLNLAAGSASGGVSDSRHATGEHRDGGRPKAFRRDARQTRLAPDAERLGRERSDEAVAIADRIGYPVLVRPSFVLGGRAMELVYNDEDLRRYMQSAIEVTPGPAGAGGPFPRRRDRSRCRLHLRRRDGSDRRDHGAHRTGRHSQRRQRLRHPDFFATETRARTKSPTATKAMARELRCAA